MTIGYELKVPLINYAIVSILTQKIYFLDQVSIFVAQGKPGVDGKPGEQGPQGLQGSPGFQGSPGERGSSVSWMIFVYIVFLLSN